MYPKMNVNYIPQNLRFTRQQLDDYINTSIPEDGPITVEDLVRVHHAFYHDKPEFDGGLYIFDRLKQKLGRFSYHWETLPINNLKNLIREDPFPQQRYMQILNANLIPEHVVLFGL